MAIKMLEVDVTAAAAYPGAPQFACEFDPKSIAVINMQESIAEDCFVSFSGGTKDDGHLKGGASLEYKTVTRRIWLRRGAVPAVSTIVQVIAEG